MSVIQVRDNFEWANTTLWSRDILAPPASPGLILQDHAKAENAVSLEDTVLYLSELLPKNYALCGEIYSLGEDCIEIAKESSWRGSTHLKLVQFQGFNLKAAVCDPNLL